jgi:hypothetical protein
MSGSFSCGILHVMTFISGSGAEKNRTLVLWAQMEIGGLFAFAVSWAYITVGHAVVPTRRDIATSSSSPYLLIQLLRVRFNYCGSLVRARVAASFSFFFFKNYYIIGLLYFA